MTIYDAVIIGLIMGGFFWGILRGFAWQLASIGALLLGYAGAYHLSSYLAPFMRQFQPGSPAIQRGVSMLIVYVAISGSLIALAWSQRTTLKKMKFELYDRHLGAILGGFEGAFLGTIGTMFVTSMSPSLREPVYCSRAGHVVAHVMDSAGSALPAEIHSAVRPFWGRDLAKEPAPVPIALGTKPNQTASPSR